MSLYHVSIPLLRRVAGFRANFAVQRLSWCIGCNWMLSSDVALQIILIAKPALTTWMLAVAFHSRFQMSGEISPTISATKLFFAVVALLLLHNA